MGHVRSWVYDISSLFKVLGIRILMTTRVGNVVVWVIVNVTWRRLLTGIGKYTARA
ncbi:hypothetical protein TorRG33x02_004530, partial [Trema orientale]